MSRKNVREEAHKLVLPITDRLGYELVEVEYVKEGTGWYLRIFIDKDEPGGVSIDDCQAVSEELGDLLDKSDLIENAYFLEISSPGIDRPLKTERDFAKSAGKEVELKLFAPINGSREFKGTLQGLENGDILILDEKNKLMKFEKNNVAVIRRTIKF